MLWPQHFQLHGVTVSTTAVKIPEVLLHGVYMNSYEKSAPSKISFNCFNHTCVTHITKTRLGGYFWKVLFHFNWSKFFRFLYSTKLQTKYFLVKFFSIKMVFNHLLILILSRSRTLLGTKIDFFCDNS